MGNRETLCDMGYEELIVFENPDYDSAIIGVSSDSRVIYSYDLMIEHLIVTNGMTIEEAVDFIDYNTLGVLVHDNSPIVLYELI